MQIANSEEGEHLTQEKCAIQIHIIFLFFES